MLIIGKTFEFEAAHQLPDEECYGQCSKLHGHTYKLLVEVEGLINDKGWVMNFKDLKAIVKQQVLDKYDHQNLNQFFLVSTAENMVKEMAKKLKDELPDGITLYSLTLWETSTSYAKWQNK